VKIRRVILATNHAFTWYFANIPKLAVGIMVLAATHMMYGLFSGMPVEAIRETVHGIWWSAIGIAAGAAILLVATDSLLKAIDEEQRADDHRAEA